MLLCVASLPTAAVGGVGKRRSTYKPTFQLLNTGKVRETHHGEDEKGALVSNASASVREVSTLAASCEELEQNPGTAQTFCRCSSLRRIDGMPNDVCFNMKDSHWFSVLFVLFKDKMKLAIAALLAGSAAAFAPAQQGKASTALNVNELEIGVTAPLGVYDPLGWLETEPESFERRRAVERKHGRVAMAAIVGCIVHNNHITFDGYLSPSQNLKFSDIPTGVDGIRAIPNAGLLQILFFFALVELAWMPASKYDGDYGVGWFGENLNPEEKARKLNAEINNGRAAMMGILGNMVVECMTGQTMYEQYAAGHISPFGDGEGVF